jgi:serine/threonine-protein kinase
LYDKESPPSHTDTLQTPIKEFTRGTTFAKRYELIEELGMGGMGRVYKVFDKKIKEEVAIKILKPEITADEKTIERFSNELKFARKITHKNVGRMYDLNEEEGTHYITMEYIAGEDLKSTINRVGQLSIGKSISITKQVCEGLVEAHKLGVIHRDLKPSNIMIDKEGNGRIMDFGIARSLRAKGITREGVMIGTPEYMSPEQIEAIEVDQRSDIYSLGVILYEMLTGQLPFKADTPLGIAMKHKSEIPKSPRVLNTQIPEELSAVILKCMEKDKEKRYQSTEALLEELTKVEKKIPTTQRVIPEKKLKPTPSGKKWKKNLLYGSTAALFTLIIASGIYFLTGGRAAQSIAVLPFTFAGDDPDDQAFCDGLAETLSYKLTQLEHTRGTLRVFSASEVRRENITSPSNIRDNFKVNLVLTGNMRRSGDMIRLTLNLLDPETLLPQGSSISFTDPITNLFTWQEDIAIQVVNMLDIKLKEQTQRLWTYGETSLPYAYEFYIKGFGYLQQDRNAEQIENSIRFFQQAIEQDPHFSLAYAGLGEALRLKHNITKNPDHAEEARSSCNLALQYSEQLLPAHLTLGRIHKDTGSYEEAVQKFREALQIDPKSFKAYTELGSCFEKSEKFAQAEESHKKAIKTRPYHSRGYHTLGYFYYVHGQLAGAENMFHKATELSPGNTSSLLGLGGIYFLRGRYDQAEATFKKIIAIRPNEKAYSNLGTQYFFQRRYGDSMEMYEEAVNLDRSNFLIWGNLADAYRYTPGYSEKAKEAYENAIRLAKIKLAGSPDDVYTRSFLAFYYSVLRDHENALAEMSKVREYAPNDVRVLLKFVQVFELCNDRDKAFQALDEYIEGGGSIDEVNIDPDLSGLLRDPRFQKYQNK